MAEVVAVNLERLDATLRQEISEAAIHQEGLLQQYRSVLFTIQALLFGAFATAYAALIALNSEQSNNAPVCVSASIKLPHSQIFVLVFAFGFLVAVFGILILRHFQPILVVRAKNVSFCHGLLILDELGRLKSIWSGNLCEGGDMIGVYTAIRLHEERSEYPAALVPIKQRTCSGFLRLREELAAVTFKDSTSSRVLFFSLLPTYFYFLWSIGLTAIILYGIIVWHGKIAFC